MKRGKKKRLSDNIYGGNDFFKYPYAAVLTGSEKLRASFKVSCLVFRVGWRTAACKASHANSARLGHKLRIKRSTSLSWAGTTGKDVGNAKSCVLLGWIPPYSVNSSTCRKYSASHSPTAGSRELPWPRDTKAIKRGGGLYGKEDLSCLPTTWRSPISPRRACSPHLPSRVTVAKQRDLPLPAPLRDA